MICHNCNRQTRFEGYNYHCLCGTLLNKGPKNVLNFPQEMQKVREKPNHADLCRTNECGNYTHGRCMLHVKKMEEQGKRVGGWVNYLSNNPQVHCPMNPPMWYVGNVGFLSVSYMQIGGTESFHQTLVPNIKGIAGFVAFNEELANGDFSLLGCQTGIGFKAAVRLVNSVKVLVVWGLGSDLNRVMEAATNRPRIISISHCNAGNTWTKQYMLQQAKHTDHFVYVNPDGLETVPMTRRDDSTMLPNGINEKNLVPSRTREEIRSSLGIPLDAKVGVMITRFSPEKGIREAMQAVRTTDHYLLVYGNASFWNKEYLRELKTLQNPRVKLMGIGKPADVLPVADYYLSCSQYEGFGLSIAEAMYMGIPVVTTHTGIASTHPKAFTLLPVNVHKEQIISAINNIRDTKDIARQLILDKYTTKHFVDNWQRFLDEQALLPPLRRYVPSSYSNSTSTSNTGYY